MISLFNNFCNYSRYDINKYYYVLRTVKFIYYYNEVCVCKSF